MKLFRYTIFLSILISIFFIVYQQSDRKGFSRLRLSLKTAAVIAAILVGLITNPVKAVEVDVPNNSTSTERVLSNQELDSLDDSTSPGSEQPSNLLTGTTGRNRIPPSKLFVAGGYLPPSKEQSDSNGQCPNIIYKIAESPALVREAEKASENQQAQSDINHLIEQLSLGNYNPGIGTRFLKGLKNKNILEARGDHGGRVYFRKKDGNIEILAKSSKKNQNKVIKILKEMGY